MISVDNLINELKERNIRSATLQFPEGLKREGKEIALQLKRKGYSITLNGDPCYGACDLCRTNREYSEVLIHFGHSQMIESRNVIYSPVFLDFPLKNLDLVLPYLPARSIGLATTVQHVHLIEPLKKFFENNGYTVLTGNGSPRTPYPAQVLGCSFSNVKGLDVQAFLFVGTGLFHPTGIALSTGKIVIAFDPYTLAVTEVNSERFLRKRFALIESARKASSFGIILSTKPGQSRIKLVKYLESLCFESIIISMQEITPDNLLNLGFDCYVNTACPRISYDDQKRFNVPVLSPGEFEILCGVRDWNQYILDEIS